MTQKTSIKKNMIMNTILTMSNFLFPILTYSYVARILSTDGTGKVAFVNSVISYFSYIAIFGIPSYGLRECAKVRDDKEKLSHLMQEIMIISIVTTTISYIALVIAVSVVPQFSQYKLLFGVMSVYIFLTVFGIEWFYQALEKYSYITVRSLVFKVIALALTFLMIQSKEDYIIYGGLTIFTTSASGILNLINARKYFSLKKTSKYDFKQHLKPISLLFFSSIAITIYANFDVVMIGFIKTNSAVGLYNSALKIKNIVTSVSTAITAVIIPRMVQYYQKDKDAFTELGLKSLRVSLVTAIPLAVYIFVNAKDVILFICGADFLAAISTLRILMLCVIPLVLTNLFGNQILIPKGKEKLFSKSVFIAMFINIFLNFLMIPKWGAAGAALGTLITECANVVIMSGGAVQERKYIFKNLKFVKYLVGFVVAFVAFIVAQMLSGDLHIILRLAITTIFMFGSYFGVLYGMKEPIIYEQAGKILKKIFAKVKNQ